MSATHSACPNPLRPLIPLAPPQTCFRSASLARSSDEARAPTEVSASQAAELDLVERLLRDEPAAWREFDARYSRIVLGCIHRVLSRFRRVAGPHDVEEIYARFCLQLLAADKKKLRAFDPLRGNKLSSWLGLLATHSSYDYLRSLRRESSVEPLLEEDRFRSDTRSPDEMSQLHEQARIAARVMAQLSERDREFVQLYFGEGLEPEQVAVEMGISVKTVYSKKHKITARLESLLLRAESAA